MGIYQEIKEPLEAVLNIQEDLDFEERDFVLLELKTNGYAILIEFMGVQVWNSDDDGRGLDTRGNYSESIEGYVRKKINSILVSLQSIEV
jgi:hypothetical protein